jgi:hypothetical protein
VINTKKLRGQPGVDDKIPGGESPVFITHPHVPSVLKYHTQISPFFGTGMN